MIEEGIIAERAGFHSLQVPDRHGRTESYFPGPEQLLTILARETEKVAIGTFTLLETLYHPMKAAEQYSVIDNLSKGRLYTTVSRGFHPGYWMQFGVPQERMLGRFNEALAVWNRAFEGERFDFDGDFYKVEQGLLAPQPWQRGGWPIWGGGNANPAAIRRSAKYGVALDVRPVAAHEGRLGRADDRVQGVRRGARQEAVHRAHARRLGRRHVRGRGPRVRHALRRARRGSTSARASTRTTRTSRPRPTSRSRARPAPDHGQRPAVHRAARALPRGVRRRLLHHALPDVEGPSLEKAAEQIQRFGEEVVQPIHKKYAAPDHPAIPEVCRW